jgi:hypothetical protein
MANPTENQNTESQTENHEEHEFTDTERLDWLCQKGNFSLLSRVFEYSKEFKTPREAIDAFMKSGDGAHH